VLERMKPKWMASVQKIDSYRLDGLQLNESNYEGVWRPDAFLGGIPCPFIGTRIQFIMYGSWAYLYHVFE
jgi:hypothetical protein